MRRAAAWAVLASIVAGCDMEPGAERSVERVEDGIRVVDSFEPAWGERAAWRVASRPDIAIPAWSAPVERDSFHLVDVRKLADGRIVVANGWADEFRIYDEEGTLEQELGGEGMAPGQFQSLAFIEEMEGSIWAFDRMGRWNVYSLDGELEGSYYLEPHGGSWTVVARFGEASLAVLDDWGRVDPGDGVERPAHPVLQYEMSGSQRGRLADLPGAVRANMAFEGGMVTLAIPFTGLPVMAGGRERFYLATDAGMAIDVLTEDGRKERRIRIPGYDLSIPEEAWDARVRAIASGPHWGEGAAPPGDDVAAWLDARRPANRPAYGRMLEDALGNLWVAEWDERYQRRIRASSTRWIVFDAEGRWLGRMETPEGLTVTQIGPDFLLGLARTASGSEARVYSLTR